MSSSLICTSSRNSITSMMSFIPDEIWTLIDLGYLVGYLCFPKPQKNRIQWQTFFTVCKWTNNRPCFHQRRHDHPRDHWIDAPQTSSLSIKSNHIFWEEDATLWLKCVFIPFFVCLYHQVCQLQPMENINCMKRCQPVYKIWFRQRMQKLCNTKWKF